MYRSSFDPAKQTTTQTLTYNSVNMKCVQDMCLDSYSTSSPSISPTSSSSVSENGSISMLSPAYPLVNTKNSEVAMVIDNLTAIQHQQLLSSYHQQQLAASVLAKRHFAVTGAGNKQSYMNLTGSPNNEQNEISKSLKMFAMLTAYSNGTEPPLAFTPYLPHSSVEAVMQDFACNGYVCDDLNRYQLGMSLSNNFANRNDYTNQYQNGSNGLDNNCKSTTYNNKSATPNTTVNQRHLNHCQQQNVNMNLNNNFWNMLPTHLQHNSDAVTAATSAAATAAAAVNIDYNCTQKKLNKRYNSSKNEKYTSPKHCVFCENNKEPEAVVKSHAVRDSLGRVLCPKLRTYVCPICKASGDMAHTVKYCPQKPIITMEDAMKAESLRLAKGNFYKQQMNV